MNKRVSEVVKYSKLIQKDFSARTGISTATLSQILSGKQAATLKTIEAIHATFPEINLDWLIFGTGEMIVPQGKSDTETNAGDVRKTESVQMAETDLFGQGSLFPAEDIRKLKDQVAKGGRVTNGKNPDILPRYITEIRVFYSDGTFESFAGNMK